MSSRQFELDADPRARRWLAEHPSDKARVIAYNVHHCCGGGKICEVRIRQFSRHDDPKMYAIASLDDGTEFLIDRRAATKLPPRFGLTVRGIGGLKHLDLDLEPEEWGTLLYD